MNQNLEQKLQNLPENPGVYQFLDETGKVIYVGKAKSLKNRVRQYFHKNLNSGKTEALVRKITDLELIVTDSEVEALVLENNLIKELKPRYNILLKDDKTYPYIVVTKEPYPRVFPTRTVIQDGSKYFGPYTDVKSMKSSLRLIKTMFKVRSCKHYINQEFIDKRRVKVCLDYHIKKCDGPCEGLVTEFEYNSMIKQVVKILRGKINDLISELKQQMADFALNMQFERAAELRDKIKELEVYSSKQKIITTDFKDRDIFAIAYLNKDCICTIFNIRSGKLIGKKELRVTLEISDEISNIYESLVKLYYQMPVEIPEEIIIESALEEPESILDWLTQKAESKVKFILPESKDLKSIFNMCKHNAELQLKEWQLHKAKREGQVNFAVQSLQRDLRLAKPPIKIECFDISNLQGSDIVASMVVFENGQPKKSEYRKFIIESVNEGTPNDFESMREVIVRRYTRLKEENKPFPDLIMIDGGKGQLSSAIESLTRIGADNYQIISLAKKLEEVFLPNQSESIMIPKTSSALKLLQQVRDEAHRFAITFHRQRRDKRTLQTELTDIDGIGEKIAEKLLKEVGSVEQIKNSSLEELTKIIGKIKAEKVLAYFKGLQEPDILKNIDFLI